MRSRESVCDRVVRLRGFRVTSPGTHALPDWHVFLCETQLLVPFLCRINQLVGIEFGINTVAGDEVAMTAVFDN